MSGTRRFAQRLLDWYDREARDLPWRRSRDPWAIWVSEIMLQQTRVEAVTTAWTRFLEKFPRPVDWAIADDDALLAAWQGLGYYRRARLLRDGAREVVERHGGAVPDNPDDLGTLSGIGEYTRGAIASIAFGVAEPAIDGNVERVFARRYALNGDVKKAATRKKLRELVASELDTVRPGDFNQALMDLGATVCRPRNPDCDRCPVREDCRARELGIQSRLPVLPLKRPPKLIRARVVLIAASGGRVLAHRIAAGQINEGQHELPGPGVLIDHPAAGATLAQSLTERYGGRFEVGDELGTIRHGITDHRITLAIHEARVVGRRPAGLIARHQGGTGWSTPSRKALALCDTRRGPN